MKNLKFQLTLLALIFSIGFSIPPSHSEWELIHSMSDEFDGTNIDSGKWERFHPYYAGPPPTNYATENSEIVNGEAVLKTTWTEPNGRIRYINSGYLKTHTQATYGYFEIEAKVQISDAATAFWLYDWETYGTFEIDVFEIGGHNKGMSTYLNSNFHYFEGDDSHQNGSNTQSLSTKYYHHEELGREYHLYGFEWDEEWMRVYFNGQLVRQVQNVYFHLPLNVRLTTEIAKNWFGIPKKEDLPNQYNIRYIRTYKKKGQWESCSNGLVRKGIQCVQYCGVDYFQDNVGICQKCHYGCTSCTGKWKNKCDSNSCKPGFEWKNGGCEYIKFKCETNEYRDENNNCKPCHSRCFSCFGPSQDQCYRCNNGFDIDANYCRVRDICPAGQVRQDEQCQQGQCNQGYFDNDGICNHCHTSCESCSGPKDTQCITCPPGFQKLQGYCQLAAVECQPNEVQQGRICQQQCNEGFYADQQRVCQECHGTCNTCSGPNQNQCNSCRDGYILDQIGKCIRDPSQKYGPPAGSDWVLVPEISDEFDGTAINETKWETVNPHYLGPPPTRYNTNNSRLENGEAVLTSSNGNPAGQERIIDSGYLKTYKQVKYGYFEIEAKVQISNAATAFWFYDWEPYGTFEIDVFEIGGHTRGMSNILHSNYHYFEGHESSQNSENTFSEQTKYHHHEPLGADYHTYGFEWDETHMRAYFDGYLVREVENKYFHMPLHLRLTTEIAQNWFGIPNREDLPSEYHIKYIRSYKKAGYWENCPNQQYRQGGICQDSCDAAHYYGEDKICHKCHYACATCHGKWKTHCDECAPGYVMYNGQCKDPQLNEPCDWSQYRDVDGICKWCNHNCDTCHGGSEHECDTCSPGYVLDGTSCYLDEACPNEQVRQGPNCQAICNSGFYNDNGTCKVCHESCKECTGGQYNQCTYCLPGNILHQGQCVPENCSIGQYKQGNQCVDVCDSGNFPDATTSICTPCDQSCQECSGASTNNCTDCRSNFSLVNGQCQLTQEPCSYGKYRDDYTGECKWCIAPCEQCNGPTSNHCTDCAPGKVLQNNTCTDTDPNACPQKQFQNTSGQCVPCNDRCSVCTGSTQFECQACEPGFILIQDHYCDVDPNYVPPDGPPDSGCPTAHFKDWTNTCQPCHQFCTVCTGATQFECTECINGKVLIDGYWCWYPEYARKEGNEDQNDSTVTKKVEPVKKVSSDFSQGQILLNSLALVIFAFVFII